MKKFNNVTPMKHYEVKVNVQKKQRLSKHCF